MEILSLNINIHGNNIIKESLYLKYCYSLEAIEKKFQREKEKSKQRIDILKQKHKEEVEL